MLIYYLEHLIKIYLQKQERSKKHGRNEKSSNDREGVSMEKII